MDCNADNNFEAMNSTLQEPLNLSSQLSGCFPDLAWFVWLSRVHFVLMSEFCYQKEAFYDLYLHFLKAQETPCTMEYSSESLVTYLTFLRNRKLRTRRCGITQPLWPLIHSDQYIIFVFALAKPRANPSFSHQHATPSLQRHTQSTIALNCLPRLKTDRHKRGPISEIAICRPLIKIHCHSFNN